MGVRIYQPTKTAMQSGRAKTHKWVVEFEPEGGRGPESASTAARPGRIEAPALAAGGHDDAVLDCRPWCCRSDPWPESAIPASSLAP